MVAVTIMSAAAQACSARDVSAGRPFDCKCWRKTCPHGITAHHEDFFERPNARQSQGFILGLVAGPEQGNGRSIFARQNVGGHGIGGGGAIGIELSRLDNRANFAFGLVEQENDRVVARQAKPVIGWKIRADFQSGQIGVRA